MYIPVSANIKQIDIPMMITGKKCLSSSVESHLEETNCLALVASCTADYGQQDPVVRNESEKTVTVIKRQLFCTIIIKKNYSCPALTNQTFKTMQFAA